MSNPYREAASPNGLGCPRCSKPLPPADLAACIAECGTWISADAAAVMLEPEEIRENRLIRWERVRAPCPRCNTKMLLRGVEPGLFQGCSEHGYWIDADMVEHTGLARTGLKKRLDQMVETRDAFRREQARREADEAERARLREAEERAREAERAGQEQQRKRAWIGAKRSKIVERVNAAIASGDSGAIVDELLRLETLIEALADRLTDVENELDGES